MHAHRHMESTFALLSNRLRHPVEETADRAGAPFARLLRRHGRVLGDAALVKIIQKLDVRKATSAAFLMIDTAYGSPLSRDDQSILRNASAQQKSRRCRRLLSRYFTPRTL